MTSSQENVTALYTTSTTAEYVDRSTLKFAYFVCLAIITVLGYVCNSLSVIVFARSKPLRQSTTGLYLLSLAVADNLFLFGQMLRWLATEDYLPGYTFLEYSDASCQFVYSLRYAAKLSSAWITVIITSERFFIIAFPLRASSICTRKNAFIAICVTYAVCFVVGSLTSLTIKLVLYKKSVMCGYFDGTYYYYNWAVLRILSLLLPGAIVLVLTVIICIKLVRARQRRARHLAVIGNDSRSSQNSCFSTIERQLTAMLLAVAITFVILRLPYTICFYLNDLKLKIWKPLDPWTSYDLSVAYKSTDLIATLNYSVNFFLYCLSGTIFRKQFMTMCGCEDPASRAVVGTMTSKTYQALSIQNNRLNRGSSRSDPGRLNMTV